MFREILLRRLVKLDSNRDERCRVTSIAVFGCVINFVKTNRCCNKLIIITSVPPFHLGKPVFDGSRR